MLAAMHGVWAGLLVIGLLLVPALLSFLWEWFTGQPKPPPRQSGTTAMQRMAEALKDGRRVSLDSCETVEFWRSLSWWDFQIAVLLWFERRGFTAAAQPPVGDGGIDGYIEREGLRIGVQCKQYGHARLVLVDEIRAFRGALAREGI